MLDTDNPKTEEELDAWLNSIQNEEKVEPSTRHMKESIQTFMTTEVIHEEKKSTPLKEYITKMKHTTALENNSFLVLQGLERNQAEDVSKHTQELLTFNLLPEHYQKLSGGFYFRADNKGFVINPGPNFLEKLHEQSLNINSIDFVIVTSPSQESFSEAKAIYDLNYKCNLQSDTLHIIHYYLHQNAYKNLFAALKPHFKQEKDTVRCLELYMDSPDIETMNLTNHVTLNYFLLGKGKENLGVTFSIQNNHLAQDLSISFISLDNLELKEIQKLQACDLVICYVNDPLNNDFQLNLLKECLEKHPQKNSLLLFQDLAKSDIDSRFLIAKYVRESLSTKCKLNKTILPLDHGILINMSNLSLRCSASHEFVNSSEIRVMKSKNSFGKLYYLGPECCL